MFRPVNELFAPFSYSYAGVVISAISSVADGIKIDTVVWSPGEYVGRNPGIDILCLGAHLKNTPRRHIGGLRLKLAEQGYWNDELVLLSPAFYP